MLNESNGGFPEFYSSSVFCNKNLICNFIKKFPPRAIFGKKFIYPFKINLMKNSGNFK